MGHFLDNFESIPILATAVGIVEHSGKGNSDYAGHLEPIYSKERNVMDGIETH